MVPRNNFMRGSFGSRLPRLEDGRRFCCTGAGVSRRALPADGLLRGELVREALFLVVDFAAREVLFLTVLEVLLAIT
ncbi:MAG: hypothetical protein JXB15_10315 [Anaerolineales bacterium]|nr:hypothetical protein [Anaerolineales bacterium]